MPTSDAVVDCHWLTSHLKHPHLLLVHAQMDKIVGLEPKVYDSMPYIKGAISINVEQQLCDQSGDQLHQMINAEQFSSLAKQIGLHDQSIVVIYDEQGIYSAPRAWWTFKNFGVKQVYVLDGGLPQWLASGGETQDTPSPYTANHNLPAFEPKENSTLTISAQQVLAHIKHHTADIIDARGQARFLAQVEEPRSGVRKGHIPGAKNLPFTELLSEGALKPSETLKSYFEPLTTNTEQQVYSCGSGITACILLLAAVHMGLNNGALYDGSWAEWGSDPQLPIE